MPSPPSLGRSANWAALIIGLSLVGCGSPQPVQTVSPRKSEDAAKTESQVAENQNPISRSRIPNQSVALISTTTTSLSTSPASTTSLDRMDSGTTQPLVANTIPTPTPTPPVAFDEKLPSDTRPMSVKDEFRGAYALSMNGREALFRYVDDTYTVVGIPGAINSGTLRFDTPQGPVEIPMKADGSRNVLFGDIPDSVPDGAIGVVEFELSGNITTGTIQIPGPK